MAERAGAPSPPPSGVATLAALDPEFPPQSRPRSCTWPLPRPELTAGEAEGGGGAGPAGGDGGLGNPEEPGGAAAAAAAAAAGGPGARKSGGGARRNAWGSQSYADLISQAIESNPDKRLTLAQIYEWMVRSVPYFRDKGDSNSSAGWKNSIRHNLSLHSKFMKVHNEATGKSSWWMLNPEGGKSGKAPRRRAASMDNNHSNKLAKVRVKASRKKAAAQAAPEPPPADSPGSQYPSRSNEDSLDVWTSIRPRANSNASTISTLTEQQDDPHDEELLPPLVYSSTASNVPPTVTEELELIEGMTLMSPPSSLLPAQPRNASFPLRAQSAAVPGPGPAFTRALFNPVDVSLHSPSGPFSGPQTLEALLTSNSPPPSDVMMTQVDPILPQSGGRLSSQTFLLPSQSNRSAPRELQLESPVHAMVTSSQNAGGLSALKSPGPVHPAQVVQLSTLPPLASASLAPFGGHRDKLPNDLDDVLYMENLECDVDYIITDLMDGEGLDFNLEPVPSTSQASNHTWVPS